MKKIIVLFYMFFGLYLSNAQVNYNQISFSNHNIIDKNFTIGGIKNVLSLDLDNDGDIDVISSSDNKIVWQENLDGLGNFGNIKIISNEVNGITSISLVDIDNDGKLDLLSSSKIDGKIAWYKNLDQGNFSSQNILISNVSSANIAKAGDVNGDGFIDVIANTNNNTIAWFQNLDGLGNFSSENIIATNIVGVSSIDINDADGDGDNDIVVNSLLTDQYIKVGLMINTNGNGIFGAFQLLNNSLPEINYASTSKVFFRDLDNDGDNDILFFSNNRLRWLTNDGIGNYTILNNNFILNIHTFYTRDRFIDLEFKDMDNDGDIDICGLIRVWQGEDKILWYENDNSNSYSSNNIILNSTSSQMNSFKIEDVNGDNIKDILAGNNNSSYLTWHKSYINTFPISKYVFHHASVKTADLDNDGDLDIISNLLYQDNKLVWYENIDGLGTTGVQKVFSLDNLITYDSYSLGDLNGDGLIDILLDGYWYENIGQGNFILNTINEAYPTSNSDVYVADINNDGDNDFIAVENLSNGNALIGWYENLDGLGNFGTRQSISFLSSITVNYIEFADIDGDNDKDIIFGGSKVGIVKSLNNLGSFETTFQTLAGAFGRIFCFDIDNDGDNDIITNNFNGIFYFKNNNFFPGNFGYNSFPLSNYSNNLTIIDIADMDNDSDLDFVVVNNSYANTYWMQNQNGTFNSLVNLITHSEINRAEHIADIDNDGKKDVLYLANTWNDALSWFKNNGLNQNRINGMVRLDINNNDCTNTDYPLQNVKIVSQDSNNTITTFTSSSGYYQMYLPNIGSYNTSATSTLSNYLTITPSSYSTNFTSIGNIEVLDFCSIANQNVNDLDVIIYPVQSAQPGFIASYVIAYHNKGTTQLNGNIQFQYDNTKLSFISSNPVANSQTSNELFFDFSNLNPFQTKLIKVNFQVFTIPTINLGDNLSFTATVNPIVNDETPIDNIFQYNEIVVGSYDPNDVTVLEGESIFLNQIDDYLHYRIRFQNTGTANAINVVVNNTLDDKLDWNSIEIEGISHNNYISINNGNQVSFIFNNIYLPYSSANESGSQGYICYKIKPKPNSVVGDVFYNNAQIYFDFNPAIHTNTVSTEVINTLHVNNFENKIVNFYPNPTNGKLFLEVNFEVKEINLLNIYGQEIITIYDKNEIDISIFSSGIYFIKIEDIDGKTIIKKIIKK